MDQGYLPGDELVELYNKNSPTLFILKQVKHGPLYNIILTIVNSIMVEFLNWKTFVLYAHFSFPTILILYLTKKTLLLNDELKYIIKLPFPLLQVCPGHCN